MFKDDTFFSVCLSFFFKIVVIKKTKKTKLENKVIELKSKIEAIEKRNRERREVEVKKRDQEIEFLKYQESHLSKFLKNISDSAK